MTKIRLKFIKTCETKYKYKATNKCMLKPHWVLFSYHGISRCADHSRYSRDIDSDTLRSNAQPWGSGTMCSRPILAHYMTCSWHGNACTPARWHNIHQDRRLHTCPGAGRRTEHILGTERRVESAIATKSGHSARCWMLRPWLMIFITYSLCYYDCLAALANA